MNRLCAVVNHHLFAIKMRMTENGRHKNYRSKLGSFFLLINSYHLLQHRQPEGKESSIGRSDGNTK